MGVSQDAASVAPARTYERHAAAGAGAPRERDRLVWRYLVVADAVGLTAAFLLTQGLFGRDELDAGSLDPAIETLFFVVSLPLWIVVANLYGLYRRDQKRTDHSTVDDLVGVFHLITIGSWLFFAGTWLGDVAQPNLPKTASFWALAITCVTGARALARARCHRSAGWTQRAVILGAGEIGRLVARKLRQHPEYGIELVGFVDAEPKAPADGRQPAMLGRPEDLPGIVLERHVDRVFVAFSKDPAEETVHVVHALQNLGVQVDIVPRLFDVVGPSYELHFVEGLPLVGLPPSRFSRPASVVKRGVDLAGASLGLLVTSPLFLFAAWRIRRESPGPVFFRQTRLGYAMREFTALKFRTMRLGTDHAPHRAYIERSMRSPASAGTNGLFKLDRDDAVTPFGRWLRRTSLDELPQLINVLRGEMSLVGPRPCIPYETEHFEAHHFERFRVPAGLTGLWQVTARAHSSFREALEMDVAYARAASLGLDVWLLLRTPLQVVRQKRGTA